MRRVLALGLMVACGGSESLVSNEAESRGEGSGSGSTATGAPGNDDNGSAADAGSTRQDGVAPGPSGPGPFPKPQFLPAPFGPCPEFVAPEIALTTSQGPRRAKIWLSDKAKSLHGPLIFYWHGWHGTPGLSGIDNASLKKLLDMGGIFVAPYVRQPNTSDDYWGREDLLTADEVVACAMQKVGIDTRHIHSIGYSAGGRETVRFSWERSGYVASVVTYSPGTNPPAPGPSQDPDNKFAALITWGATEDPIYQQLAEDYFDKLTADRHFAVMCKHAGGHVQPSPVVTQALSFLLAHPFKVTPSPYAGGLPNTLPTYCGLTK